MRSLAWMPSAPFLWMGLACVDDVREGFRPVQLGYLRLSYLYRAGQADQSRLSDVSERQRPSFGKALNTQGFDVDTPGILRAPPRSALILAIKGRPINLRRAWLHYSCSNRLGSRSIDKSSPGLGEAIGKVASQAFP
jgi:hypothetical protein